ncbi:cupin domain-containing protein [Aquisphaera insulae]|uniref:cupin domain-containing protein n=1 Tax=Aquisphaera insulae TaxID=2712864 RepID=UPI0013EC1DD3|nr:cupin domain-containing protein [Aquisphaera insulae]
MPHPSATYTHIPDLLAEVNVPTDGILSRTIFSDDRSKIVLFGFGAGQELSEHTSSMPATLQFLSGGADVGLGDDTVQARPGTFIHMPPGLPHSVRATAPTVMVLTLFRGE